MSENGVLSVVVPAIPGAPEVDVRGFAKSTANIEASKADAYVFSIALKTVRIKSVEPALLEYEYSALCIPVGGAVAS